MRDKVKYRAMVLNTTNWIYRQPFHIRGAWYMYDSGWDMVPINIKTLGQCTGLEDKNGTEIYEGDIVTFKVERGVTRTESIIYERGSFGVEQWHLDDMKHIEIIGNVHERKYKHLLEGELIEAYK